MNRRKVKASRTYICSHCGFEIVAVYDSGNGQVLESRPGRLASGYGARIYDPKSGRATLICQDCGKETRVVWNCKPARRMRLKS